MWRRALLLASLGLLVAPTARAAPPRLIAVGSGGYALAGADVLQAAVPATGAHTGVVRLLRTDGTRARVGTVPLPRGAVTGVAADASASGSLVFYGVSNDLAVDLFPASGPLTGPLTPLEPLAPDSFTSGWLLDGDAVLALRQRPGSTAALPQGSIATLGLDGRLVAERPLALPPGDQDYELRAQGPRQAVVFASDDAHCRAEAQVLDTAQPAVRVPADRRNTYCAPTWVDWQVQADGKLAAVEQSRDGTRRLSWFGTDGVRHRVPGLVDPGVGGLGFARDRLLYARRRSPGRSDLVIRRVGGGERVLAHLDVAAAGRDLDDFDGTRALWTTSRCGATMRAYLAADVGTTTVAPAAPPVVCGVTEEAHEVPVADSGTASATFACHASRSLRCVGEARLSLHGRLVSVIPLRLRGGEVESLPFTLDAGAMRVIGRAEGGVALRDDIRWRDEHQRRRRAISRLYVDAP